MLHIHLFGGVQAFDDGRPLPQPTPGRVPALWAYLLLKRQWPTPCDCLAYTLWPDVTEEEARAGLRRHLYLLRRQLPATSADTPWILTGHDTVQWNSGALCRPDVAINVSQPTDPSALND